jgi:hypothetical protein
MQTTAAPRSDAGQRPQSLDTAPAVRLSDLGWPPLLRNFSTNQPENGPQPRLPTKAAGGRKITLENR